MLEEKLICQGAEGSIYKSFIFSSKIPCIIKERTSKSYRFPKLDELLTLQRFKAEVRQLIHCLKCGIEAPAVLYVDQPRRRIYMTVIDGVRLGDYIEEICTKDNSQTINSELKSLSKSLGYSLAKLHANHIVHRDLSTANIMISLYPESEKKKVNNDLIDHRVSLLDFGLSSGVSCGASQRLMEEKAVDLYVFERAITSSMRRDENSAELISPEEFIEKTLLHYQQFYPELANSSIMPSPAVKKRKINDGKTDQTRICSDLEFHKKALKEIINRLDEVRMRGRKRICIG